MFFYVFLTLFKQRESDSSKITYSAMVLMNHLMTLMQTVVQLPALLVLTDHLTLMQTVVQLPTLLWY